MAVTKKGFRGELRQAWEGAPDDVFPTPASAEEMIQNIVGAKAAQSPAARGLGSSTDGYSGVNMPARRLYSAGAPGEGSVGGNPNAASTGRAGAVPASVDQTGGPSGTGAGMGQKIVVKHGPGGSAPSGLTQGGGGLGRNTAR